MKILSTILCLLFSSPFSCFAQTKESTQKHNLLFIMTDQQHYFTSGAYGNEMIQTPALDGLANESFVFEKAYVSQPVCAPSRSTLMTGLFPHTNGVVDNNRPLSPEMLTLPEMINDRSYRSAYIGKWHLGNEVFKQRGFGTWVSMEDGYADEYGPDKDKNTRSDYHHWLLEKGYTPNRNNNRFSRKFAAGLPIEHCKPAFLAEKTVEYLSEVGDEPFILYVSFLEPHKPFTGPLNELYDPDKIILPENFYDTLDTDHPLRYRSKAQSDAGKYPSENAYRELIAKYWGLVSQVDRSLKKIFDKLDELELADNTTIVFTSDHGSMMGSHGLVSKDVMYEESARVPLFIKDTRLTKEKKWITEPVSQIDLVPTLMELLGQPIPSHLHGESLVPYLSGDKQYRKDVFIEWPGVRTIVSQDGWKMSLFEEDKSLLFNLYIDPLETTNLFYKDESRVIIEDLGKRIKKWQEDTHDDFAVESVLR